MSPSDAPIAYPHQFAGVGVHERSFVGSGFGVVFEDDGETGYFYATTESFDTLDALPLYDKRDPAEPRIGETVYIVWQPVLRKAGIFYDDTFHAVIDFRNRKACCRSGFPPKSGSWCTSSHKWDDRLAEGLEP